jgi:hypothetical protein
VNDFETVRAALALPDVIAALDRIEAEVERLRAKHEVYRNQAVDDYFEVKREVERLRAGREEDLRLREKWQDEVLQSKAEVERLRNNAEIRERVVEKLLAERNEARAALAKEVRPTQTDP